MPTHRASGPIFDQVADAAPPLSNASILRSTAIIGIQFFAQLPGRAIVPFREPQRVDRRDAASPAP
jgi:hypothetical protein